MALKDRLRAEGTVFATDTDAEVIAHLIASSYRDDLARAVVETLAAAGRLFRVRRDGARRARRAGRRAARVPAGRRARRRASPSSPRRCRPSSRTPTQVQYVENGEIVVLGADSVAICDASGVERERAIETLDWDEETAEKGGYDTFMRKEIDEQAQALAETIADRTARGDGVDLAEPGVFDEAILRGVERVTFVGCGTAYHAGLLGRYALEEWARIAAEVDVASEYRYRDPVLGPGDLVVAISQSGETADTLAAMRLARERGARVLALTNTMGSQATRDSDAVLYTRAGLEIGVAATKTFVCQIGAVYLLALRLAELRGTLAPARIAELVAELRRLPQLVDELAGTRYAGGRGGRRDLLGRRLLPLHRPPGGPADRARGGAQAEGDRLHLDRRLRLGGDEARSDRDARRAHAGDLRRHRLAGARAHPRQRRDGPRARREGDRDHQRRRRQRGAPRRVRRSRCRRPTRCSRRCSP
jgi:glucosamine--fructose-6-phosphate aminotransferase (isomerizing)